MDFLCFFLSNDILVRSPSAGHQLAFDRRVWVYGHLKSRFSSRYGVDSLSWPWVRREQRAEKRPLLHHYYYPDESRLRNACNWFKCDWIIQRFAQLVISIETKFYVSRCIKRQRHECYESALRVNVTHTHTRTGTHTDTLNTGAAFNVPIFWIIKRWWFIQNSNFTVNDSISFSF